MPSEAIVAIGIYVLGLIVIPPLFGFFVDVRHWDSADGILFEFLLLIWPIVAVFLALAFVVDMLVFKPLEWLSKMMLKGGSKARDRYDEWQVQRAKKALEKKQKEEATGDEC